MGHPVGHVLFSGLLKDSFKVTFGMKIGYLSVVSRKGWLARLVGWLVGWLLVRQPELGVVYI